MNFIFRKIDFLPVLLIILNALHLIVGAQEVSNQNEVTNQPSNSREGIEVLGGTLYNNSFLLGYYRNSFVVEITGNEATIGAAFRTDLTYEINYNGYDYRINTDFYLMEQLSLRGRFYENFNPPIIYPNDISMDIHFFQVGNLENRLHLGMMKSLFDVIPMKSYYLPVVYSVGRSAQTNQATSASNEIALSYINHPLVVGHRDLPIAYLITPHYDTGIYWEIRYFALEILLGLSNGEIGLDSNSAKTIIGRFAYRDEEIFGGLAFQIGNLGSVPIKENQHLGKLFFYYETDTWTVGGESMLLFHGLRDIPVTNRNVKEEFAYYDGFFSPFTVYNDGSYDDSLQFSDHMLYGLAASLFFKLQIADFKGIVHASIYDPNLLAEHQSYYKRRYRGFLSLSYDFTPFLKGLFSYTYTYDHYFLSHSQFYDSTEPRSLHPIIDHDFYAGMVFSFM